MSHLIIVATKPGELTDKTINKFKCEETGKTIFANALRATASPFNGEKLANITTASKADGIILTAGEIDSELNDIGNCDHCKVNLHVSESFIREIEHRKSIYCPVCAMENEFSDNSENDDMSDDMSETDDMSDEDISDDDMSENDLTSESDMSEDDMSSDEDTSETDDMSSDDESDLPPLNTDDTTDTSDDMSDTSDDMSDTSENDKSLDTTAGTIKVTLSKVLATDGGLQVTPVNDTTALVSNKEDQPVGLLESDKALNDNAELFKSPDALESAIAAVSKGNITIASLAPFGFTPIVIELPINKIIADEISEKVEQGVEPLRKQLENTRNGAKADNAQALAIASTAMVKRIFPDLKNPVRDNLVKILAQNGVKGAETIVDSVFNAHGPEMVENIVKKADEISTKTEAERNVLASVVAEAMVPVISMELPTKNSATSALESANLDKANPIEKPVTVTASENKSGVRDISYFAQLWKK